MILNNIKCYCINLDRAQDRWTRVLDNCSKINQKVERFNAYEGKKLTKDDVPNAWDHYGNGASGCSLSHYKLWQHILNTDLPYACILEDDAYILEEINNILILDEDFDVLYISERIHADSRRRACNGCGTESYIVSRKGCEKLLKVCEDMRFPIDMRIQSHMRGFIQGNHSLCQEGSIFKSKINNNIIIESYKYKNFTKHEDHNVSYVN